MKKSPVILSLVYFVSLNVVTSEHAETDDRIVGGYNISIDDVPYQAFLGILRGKKLYLCGGSIISKHYILTAAHCLIDATMINLFIGFTDIEHLGPKYKTSSYSIHPSYNNVTQDYDVALAHIRDGLKLEDVNAKMIRLPDADTPLVTGDELLVSGWGKTKEESMDSSRFLKAVKVPILPDSQCKAIYNHFTHRFFCAGFLRGKKDACQGDSGGPAVSLKSGIQIGITSNGIGCARPGKPGVYIKIANPEVRKYISDKSGV